MLLKSYRRLNQWKKEQYFIAESVNLISLTAWEQSWPSERQATELCHAPALAVEIIAAQHQKRKTEKRGWRKERQEGNKYSSVSKDCHKVAVLYYFYIEFFI